MTYYSFNINDHICIRLTARAYSNIPYVDYRALTSFGHTGSNKPLYPREALSIFANNQKIVEIDNPQNGATIAHGQGILKLFRYDFSQKKVVNIAIDTYQTITPASIGPWFTAPTHPSWMTNFAQALIDYRVKDNLIYAPFEGTRYTPREPFITGSQGQFGVYQILPEAYSGFVFTEVWRKQLYPEAHRTNALLHSSSNRVQEKDFPLAVYHNGTFHGNSKGKHWIKYTDENNPWLDKVSITPRWHGWDDQHWSLGALAQVYQLTQDPKIFLVR